MYTQWQRCIATILLFSIFLQSCGNPHWKMVEPVEPGSSGKKGNPAKINQRKLLLKQEDAHELHGELSHGGFDASSGSSCDEPSSTSVVLTPSQRRAPSSLVRSSKPLTESREAISVTSYRDQLRHRRRDKALPSGRVGSVGAQAPATPTLSPLLPAPQRSQQATRVVRKPTTQARLMVPYASLPSNPVTPSYPSAQGHQVRFQQQFGAWMAEVQDGWGRTQRLPVICRPEQEPEQAIQQLSSKSLGQHKYWVHVLEAHQPPWSPRVVYVGYLGLQGGMPQKGKLYKNPQRVSQERLLSNPDNRFISQTTGAEVRVGNLYPSSASGSNQSHSQSSTRGSSAAFHGSGRSSPQSNSSNAWSGSYRPASSPTSQSFDHDRSRMEEDCSIKDCEIRERNMTFGNYKIALEMYGPEGPCRNGVEISWHLQGLSKDEIRKNRIASRREDIRSIEALISQIREDEIISYSEKYHLIAEAESIRRDLQKEYEGYIAEQRRAEEEVAKREAASKDIEQRLSEATSRFSNTKASIASIATQVAQLKRVGEVKQEQLLALCAPLDTAQKELLELAALIFGTGSAQIKGKILGIADDIMNTCGSCEYKERLWDIQISWSIKDPNAPTESLNGNLKRFYDIVIARSNLQVEQLKELHRQLNEEAKKFSDSCAWCNDELTKLIEADYRAAFLEGPEKIFRIMEQYVAVSREEGLASPLLQERLKAVAGPFEEFEQALQMRAATLRNQAQTTPSVLREPLKAFIRDYPEKLQCLLKSYHDSLAGVRAEVRRKVEAHSNRAPSPPPATPTAALEKLQALHLNLQQKLTQKKEVFADLEKLLQAAPEALRDQPGLKSIYTQLQQKLEKDQEEYEQLAQNIQQAQDRITLEEHMETIASVLSNQAASPQEKAHAWALAQELPAILERQVQAAAPSEKADAQESLQIIKNTLPHLRAKLIGVSVAEQKRVSELLVSYQQAISASVFSNEAASPAEKALAWSLTEELLEVLQSRAEAGDTSERTAAQEALQTLQEALPSLRALLTTPDSQQHGQALPATAPSTRVPSPDPALGEEHEAQASLANADPVDFSVLLSQEERSIEELDNLLQKTDLLQKNLQFHVTENEGQELPPNKIPTPWHSPFVQQGAPTSELAASGTAPSASEAFSAAHAQTEEEEDSKMPSLPRGTTFSTPEEAQAAVGAYLARWRLETPAGRVAIRAQGKEILRGVEALKKTTKHSYRHQVLGFETQDIDPLVWERVLTQQRAAQEQLHAVRDLRSQLLDACQVHGPELQEAGIRTIFDEDKQEEELYSSDEDEQAVSDAEMAPKTHRAFVAGIGQVLQGRIEDLSALAEDPIGTTIANYVTLLSSIPELPELLCDYIEEFLHEADEERKAEMLGSLLTEVILLLVRSPKANIAAGVSKKLGKAAQRVASKPINQLNTLVKKGRAPRSILKFHTAGDPQAFHTPVEHVHFKDGSALRKDGVWRHGYKKLTNEEIKFLKAYGWKIPE